MTPYCRLLASARRPLRLLCRLAAAVALATFSGALAAQEDQAFVPGCALLPFEPLRVTHPIDTASGCGRNGRATQDAGLAAGNMAKNNFCAQGPPVVVTHATFAQLQRAVDRLSIPAGPRRQPADRSVLHNLLTIRPGVTIGEGSLVQLVTFIVTAHFADVESGESVNCNLSGKENNDIHVVLGESPDIDLCNSVTAEISPHFRPLEWEDFVLDRVERPVRITGQLFFDGIHRPCKGGRPSPGGPSRQSVWEIHPVYGIEVCTSSTLADCPAGDPSRWQPIDPLTARNRAGLEYLAQGLSADAVRVFAGAEGAILASDHTPSDKARFLYNYGVALDQSHQSAAAANLYLQALQLDAGVKEPLTALLKLPGTAIAKPSEALSPLVDRLLAQGDLGGAADTVRYALVKIPPGDRGFEDALARLLITYLTAAEVGPRCFRNDWNPLLDKRLPTLGADAQARFKTEQGLYLDEIPVIFRQEDAGATIVPWKPCDEAMRHTVPPQPCDAANLVALLRVIGDGFSREGSPQGALSRFALAWSTSRDPAAAIQVAGLLLANPQLDAGRLKEGFVASLFERKGEAYLEGDLVTAFRLHVVLASLFERSEMWGNEGEPASAIYQLDHALQISQQLGAGAVAQRDAIPALHARLARAYVHERRSVEAFEQYLSSARSYLAAGRPEGADTVLFLARQLLASYPGDDWVRLAISEKPDHEVGTLMLQTKQVESAAASHRTPSDSSTTERVLAKLRADPELRLDQLHVSTKNGIVSISGESARSSWPDIERLVTSTADVKAVRQVPERRGAGGARRLDPGSAAGPAVPGLLPFPGSGATLAQDRVTFVPGCDVPFAAIATAGLGIDQQCGIDGGSCEAAKKAESTAKNNFCVKGPPTPIQYTTFSVLEAAVTQPQRQAAKTSRTVLKNVAGNLGEGALVQFAGYVLDAHVSNVAKGELVNCTIGGELFNDIHIDLVATPEQDDACQSVTAEMSPHLRPETWTALPSMTIKRQVRVTGPLFFDGSHRACHGTARPSPNRISVWEIHPVYQFEVCRNKPPATCKIDDDDSWIPLDQWRSSDDPETDAGMAPASSDAPSTP
jgi:tetratricopeptide (TPR) repeat protein